MLKRECVMKIEEEFQNVEKETKQWKIQESFKNVVTTFSRSNMRLNLRPGR